jgi:hypothetical protein
LSSEKNVTNFLQDHPVAAAYARNDNNSLHLPKQTDYNDSASPMDIDPLQSSRNSESCPMDISLNAAPSDNADQHSANPVLVAVPQIRDPSPVSTDMRTQVHDPPVSLETPPTAAPTSIDRGTSSHGTSSQLTPVYHHLRDMSELTTLSSDDEESNPDLDMDDGSHSEYFPGNSDHSVCSSDIIMADVGQEEREF